MKLYEEIGISGKDREIIDLIVRNPNITDKAVGEALGISKQAAAQRRKRITAAGLVRTYSFLNVENMWDKLWQFDIKTNNAENVIASLEKQGLVVFTWFDTKKSLFSGLVAAPSQPILKNAKITQAEFRSFLDTKLKLVPKTTKEMEWIAKYYAEKFLSKPSVEAILWTPPKKRFDMIELVIILGKGAFQQHKLIGKEDFYENCWVDLHFTNFSYFRERYIARDPDYVEWLRDSKMIFAKKSMERKLALLKKKILILIARDDVSVCTARRRRTSVWTR